MADSWEPKAKKTAVEAHGGFDLSPRNGAMSLKVIDFGK